MDHPFTAKLELDEQQLDTVAGGSQIVILPNDVEKLKPLIKPAMGSTMAIGEEGGGFNYV